MKVRNATIAILAAVTFGTGCKTCNKIEKDVGTLKVCPRPLSLSEALTKEEHAEADAWANYAKGCALEEEGKIEAAQEYFFKAMENLPDNEKVLEHIVGTYFREGKTEQLRDKIADYLDRHPDTIKTQLIYSELLDITEKHEEATKHLEKLLPNWKKFGSKIHELLIERYMLEERYAETEACYQQLFNSPDVKLPTNFLCTYPLFILQWCNYTEECGKSVQVEKISQLCPDVDAFRKKARSFAEELAGRTFDNPEDYTSVAILCDKADYVDLLPSLLTKVECNDKNVSNYMLLKLRCLEANDANAYNSYVEDLYAEMNLPPPVLFKLIQIFEQRGDVDRAIEMATLLLGADGNFSPLVDLAMRSKRYDDALDVLNGIQKKNFHIFYVMSQIYRAKGDFKRAYLSMHLAEQSVKREKINIDRMKIQFYFSFAIICEGNGNIVEGLNKAKLAWECDKTSPETCNFYGYMLADHNQQLEKAKELIELAVKEEPDNAAYLDSMAWVLFRLKDYKGALKYILKAIDIYDIDENDDGVLSDHAGDICNANSMKDLARHFWNIALPHSGTYSSKIRAKLDACPK